MAKNDVSMSGSKAIHGSLAIQSTKGRVGERVKIDHARYLALVAAMGGLAGACSSGSTTGGGSGTDGGSSSSGGSSGGTSGSSSGSGSGSSSGSSGSSSGSTCSVPCGANCCNANATCIQDAAGNKSCALRCADSAQCPATDPCCDPSFEGGACVPAAMSMVCRCSTSSECATGSCSPMVDATQNPIGPYVCTQNDGAPYHGCNGSLTFCSGNYCCVDDVKGNEFCALPCTNSTMCGTASCKTYSFSHTSCTGPSACGPVMGP